MNHACITIVSGLPRSGTSMLMNMLAAGGMSVMTDGLREADDDNPRGYFELESVKKLTDDSSWLKHARGQAVKVISQLLYELPDTETYRVLFMHRRMSEILASQERMLERRGLSGAGPSDDVLASKFSAHLEAVDQWLDKQKHFACLPVQYDAVIEAPEETAVRIRDFLGIDLDTAAMAAAVDPSLYRNRHR